MKKRIEKVVERTESSRHLTIGKKYPVHSESKEHYSVKDDEGDIGCWDKSGFKVVSEKEILEFDIEELNTHKCNIKHLEDFTLGSSFMVLKFNPDVNPNDYNLKVIATPKDSPYEGKSKEELIEIIKELKLKK